MNHPHRSRDLCHGEGEVPEIREADVQYMEQGSPEEEPFQWSRRHKPSVCLIESIEQGGLAFTSIFDDVDGDEEIQQQILMSDPITYSASSDPDVMYVDQAMKQPDRKQFIKAMAEEVEAHTNNHHWQLIQKS